jgi:hypothetical protein
VNFLPKASSVVLPPKRRLGAEFWLRMLSTGNSVSLVLVGLLLITLPSAAQIELGDTKMNLSGDIGFNYDGSMNQGASGHSLALSGDADLTGSYYNPGFLNFSVRPFFGRNQSNSVFAAVTNSSGVNSGLNLFSGSHFPGSFFFSKIVNSSGEYGVPGSAVGLATNGDNQGFGVSWSALVPDWPTLTASYAVNSGSSSIYGTQQESKQTDHDLTLTSTYSVAGFRIAGGYSHRNVDGTVPEVLEGIQAPVQSSTATNNYQVNAGHSFPMSGAYSISYSRTGYDYSYHDGTSTASSGASDSLNGNLNFRPAAKLSVGFSAAYNDSLLGGLPEQVIGGGKFLSLGTFRSYFVGSDAHYQLLRNLSLQARVNHVEQTFLGRSYGATQFGASANYNAEHSLLKGLSFGVGVVDTATKEGNTALGFVGNLNYSRKLRGWDLDANFSYSQNVQTLVIVDTTSSYGWVTNVRRRVGNRSYFIAGYSASHSGFNTISDSSSSAQRVSSGFTYRRYSANGFYSTSRGRAAFTSTGLVALPGNLPPEALPPGTAIVFDSKAYGFNASASPLRRLTLTAGYAQSSGDTIDQLTSVFTKSELINGVAQYRLRKIFVNGGYTHLRQSVGTPGTAPVTVTTYYIGISRWFNFF